MEYYYVGDIVGHKSITLLEDEHVHCTKVMRHKVGDLLEVLDGKGSIFQTKIIDIKRHETVLEILKVISKNENDTEKVIAISPTKNPSRLEWFVEKATEMGVTSIFLIHCERTDKKNIKPDRLKKITISALKQSGATILPNIVYIDKLEKLISLINPENYKKFVAHCENEEEHLFNLADSNQNQIVLIGPEGDFTQNEIQWAIRNEFIPVSLGKNRLRTETAGLYALFCLGY